MTKQFFYNGRFLGQAILSNSRSWEQHTVWTCQRCGEAYAREVVVGSERDPVIWQVMLGCCQRCRPAPWHWNQVAGSVWRLDDAEGNLYLPEEVVRQELLLVIKAYEKGYL